jgi:quercetin dioxygenase-like cupin family protein
MEFGDATILDAVGSLEMRASRSPIYDRDVTLRLLYEDPDTGAEHYVIRYPAGLRTLRHRHTHAHTIIVLEGHLMVNGRVVGPGAYCHFPAGQAMHHEPAGEEACLFVVMFDGPVDVEPLEQKRGVR